MIADISLKIIQGKRWWSNIFKIKEKSLLGILYQRKISFKNEGKIVVENIRKDDTWVVCTGAKRKRRQKNRKKNMKAK